MSSHTPNDEQQVNRRLFLQFTAAATASAGALGIAMKTDALAKQVPMLPVDFRDNGDDGMPYPYNNGP